ncbi:MAG: dihydrolipoamide acetyltransferase family protein, partial [Pseudomonadota bacterium]
QQVPQIPGAPAEAAPPPPGPSESVPEAAAAPEPSGQAGGQTPRSRSEIRVTPLARKLAADEGVDIFSLTGSGPGGRIKKRDVESFLAQPKQAPQPAQTPPPAAAGSVAFKTVREVVPVRGTRKVIAQRLYDSLQQMAQFSDMGEMDVSATVAYRKDLVAQQEAIGVKITYNAILVKVAALALKAMPLLNSSIVEDEIHLYNEINVGMAVDGKNGLIVPVVHNADQKSIADIQHELNDLIERAREGNLLPDQISGGTMTISNFGSYGTITGTPIINPPEVILLGIGIIRQIPVVVDNEIQIGWSMSYSLTMDHRVVDGATGGRYIQRIRDMLAAPYLMGVLWS